MNKAKDRSLPFFLVAAVLTFVLPFMGQHWDIGLGLILALFVVGCASISRNPRLQS